MACPLCRLWYDPYIILQTRRDDAKCWIQRDAGAARRTLPSGFCPLTAPAALRTRWCEAEQLARDHGYAVRRTKETCGGVGARVGKRGSASAVRPHRPGPHGALHHRRRHADDHQNRRAHPAPPWTGSTAASTRDGRIYTGTISVSVTAAHVFDDVLSPAGREESAVRIDEVVEDRASNGGPGHRPGDFVCIDPKTVVTDSGFLRSVYRRQGAQPHLLTLLRPMHRRAAAPVRYRGVLHHRP